MHKILLVDDHLMFRQALNLMLKTLPDFKIIGEAADGAEAVELAKKLKPDIVLMDIGMPRVNGIEATRQIRAAAPNIKIIALSSSKEHIYMSDIINAGASGYVSKFEGMDDLQAALEAVVQNKKYLGQSVLNPLIESIFKDHTVNTVTLTTREEQVMHRIVGGKTSLQIAMDLNIAVGTVEAHRRNLMRKLQLHNAVELTHYVLNAR